VAKTRPIPAEDDLTVIYLDSYDELRRLDASCKEVWGGHASDRHECFLRMCQEKGLSLNEGKRVVAATQGTLQGGIGW